MSGRLRDKVALVIGAGSVGPGWGNGKAAAVLFAREGAKVVCADINRAAAEETRDIISGEGGEAIAIGCDATRSGDVADAVAAAVDTYGGLTVLDNNVGIAEVGGVVDLPEETWDRVSAVNLKSVFLAMKHAIPAMEASGGGAIVNISSIASIRYTGVPYSTYYATKAAVNHLTSTTAVEVAARGIRVNAVLPGLMKTPMVEHSAGLADVYSKGDVEEMWRKRDAQVPMGHMGDAWDVAHAALFLASDEARYITGHALVVDGGITLKYS
ncbi:SDR family oxidoreductase [Stappia sp.]|uniref:SDR family NAD(P)-dependent oxidoreductase n=1 Tax=Stappia sp. TaxID=1870903 RepID=UPI0032D938D0